MDHAVKTIIKARARMLKNSFREVRSHIWVHVLAGLGTLFLLVGVGGYGFYRMFRFLLQQEIFGPPLMERLLAIVLLAFFSMLIFSNLIITLTTTYISRDTEFLFGYPIRFKSVFVVKLTESVFYSSWAFVLLSLPMFAAYGYAKGAPFEFYILSFIIGIPFLFIPAAIGALLTMLLSAFLPAKRARSYSIGLIILGGAVSLGLVRLMGLKSLIQRTDESNFNQLMDLLNIGSVPLLPNFWLSRGLRAASEGNWQDYLFWTWCLLITAVMFVQICLWVAPFLYYRGWTLAKEAASATHTTSGGWFFPLTDKILKVFPSYLRALIGKDIRTFLRDPSQWSQLVILFGLLLTYIANIRGLTKSLSQLERYMENWPIFLSYFNLGATCFVMCILTTRFIYPMLSLEGKQYWIVGLAPFPKQRLVWEKFGLCLGVTLPLALTIILFSNYMLNVSTLLAWISLITVILQSVGLTTLAVGLSAIFPDFKQDNPARIANGLGGTINIVVSLIYIILSLMLSLFPAIRIITAVERGSTVSEAFLSALNAYGPWIAGTILIHALIIFLPMKIGLKHWNRLEISN